MIHTHIGDSCLKTFESNFSPFFIFLYNIIFPLQRTYKYSQHSCKQSRSASHTKICVYVRVHTYRDRGDLTTHWIMVYDSTLLHFLCVCVCAYIATTEKHPWTHTYLDRVSTKCYKQLNDTLNWNIRQEAIAVIGLVRRKKIIFK